MKALIYACEDQYQGLHGMNNFCVEDVNSYDEAYAIGVELAIGVINSYDILMDYFDEEYENDPDGMYDAMLETCIVRIVKINDGVNGTNEELENSAYDYGVEQFMYDFCEEWDGEI